MHVERLSTDSEQMFGNYMMHNVRKHSRKPVKVFGWVSCSAIAMSHFFGPASPNKDKNLQELIEAESERTGKSVVDVSAEVLPCFFSILDVAHDFRSDPIPN